MSKNINISFIYTKELAIKASKLFYDYDMKNSSKRYIGWLFIALMQFGVVGALKHDSFGVLFVSTFLVIYWYYIRWYIRKNMIIKYYEKHIKNSEQESHFVLNEDGLKSQEAIIGWDDIKKAIKIDDGVLLQTSTNTLFFQKSAFDSYEDMQEFLENMKKREKV